MFQLEGARIILRDHQADDLEAFHAWLSDPVVTRYLSWRPATRTATREESFMRLADALREAGKEPRTKYYLALVRREDGRVLGEAGFTVESRGAQGGVADLGWFLLRPYWGQGYATEAAQLLIAYCFTVLGLHKVTACCDAENRASEQVMLRCGMTREACHKKQHLLDGAWRDRLEYALLSEDWVQQQSLLKPG
jgi:[ribosomal protein S5]-alanine N-acetyltransferase